MTAGKGWAAKKELALALANRASLLKKIMARLGMVVKLGEYHPRNFSAPTEFFLFKCPNCRRLSADCLHTGDRLDCHLCN